MDANSAGIDLTASFGPVYIGFVISLLLGGMTIVQAYMYFPHPSDTRAAQMTALAMLVLDIISSELVAQSIYYYLLPRFGSLAPFGSVTRELSAECLLSTIITLISQLYFVYQLKSMQNLQTKLWWTDIAIYLITFFSVVAAAGGVACVASMFVFHHGVLMNRNRTFAIFFGIAKGAGAIADILATIALSITLKAQRTSTSMQRTNMVIKSVIQYIVQRGILVTLIQVLLLITFYAAPTRLIWFAVHVNVTKLYANTFFAMLNGRDSIRKSAQHSMFGTLSGNLAGSQAHSGKVDFRAAAEHHDMDDMQGRKSQSALPTITKTVVIQDI